MSAPVRQREQEPSEHPERMGAPVAVVLLAGSTVVNGFTAQADAVEFADLFARVHSRRIDVRPAGCGGPQWWGVFPSDSVWREQCRLRGYVHAHRLVPGQVIA